MVGIESKDISKVIIKLGLASHETYGECRPNRNAQKFYMGQKNFDWNHKADWI